MKRNEKGFTLINLAVVIAISAIIAAGAGMTTAQIIQGSQHSRDWATAARQAQNVGYWLGQDILTAQTVNVTDDLGTADIEFVIMSWKDWETGETYDIRYVWLDSADSLKKLKRKQLTCDEDGVEIGNKTTLIADNINTANLSSDNGTWSLCVEARSGEKSAAKEYEIYQRLMP